MPEDMSEDMPEDMPDRMPEDLPDRMPEDMPEDMSDRMPQDLPVRTCINVMVGITRSKVIFFTALKSNFWEYVKLDLKNGFNQINVDIENVCFSY